MRFIGYIYKCGTLIGRASAINREDDTVDEVVARISDSLVRDMRRNNTRLVHATTARDRADSAAFDKLVKTLEDCVRKTAAHGKNALVTAWVQEEKVIITESLLVAPSGESKTEMVLFFEAKSDEAVLQNENILKNLFNPISAD